MEISNEKRMVLIAKEKGVSEFHISFKHETWIEISHEIEMEESIYIPYDELQEFCDIILNKAIELGKVKVGK